MPARFSVLASSSSGNASLLEIDGRGVLIDCGIGPRKICRLLDSLGSTWDCVDAVLLTHLHGDHWNESTMRLLARTGTPLWCHVDHAAELEHISEAFHDLRRDGLVRSYHANLTFELSGCTCTPLPLWHDVTTFGFRIDGVDEPWAIGYASDLGSWTRQLVERMCEIDLLALEFNHDVQMQLASCREESLIERVLGQHGHLSNAQAGQILTEILTRTTAGRLRHVVPLHLSRECNRPELVLSTIESVRRTTAAEFAVAMSSPGTPTPWRIIRGSVESFSRSAPSADPAQLADISPQPAL